MTEAMTLRKPKRKAREWIGKPPPTIGTSRWWHGESQWTHRGVCHSILRLLEQGEISTLKALELLHYAIWPALDKLESPPSAPFDRLNWCNGVEVLPRRRQKKGK